MIIKVYIFTFMYISVEIPHCAELWAWNSACLLWFAYVDIDCIEMYPGPYLSLLLKTKQQIHEIMMS